MVMSVSSRKGVRLAAVLASSVLMGVGAGVPAHADDKTAQGHHRNFSASLTGANERPDPGDPDGRGTAHVELNKSEICFELSWSNIGGPAAAHIHEGSKDVAGPVVVTLFDGPQSGSSQDGCVKADSDLIADIREDPRDYYVNIHNAKYPAGAIRGQLHVANMTPTGGVDAGGGGTAGAVVAPAALSVTSVALPAAGIVGGLVLSGAGALVLRRGRTRTDV